MGYIQQLRALVGHRPLIMVGAAVLIVDPQNCLLLQRRQDNSQWGLIGGSLEVGESLEECARREVHEETGLELGEIELFGIFSGQELIYKYPNGDVVANVVVAYLAQQFRGEIKACSEEASELRFFDLKELPEDLSPPDKPILEQYLYSLT